MSENNSVLYIGTRLFIADLIQTAKRQSWAETEGWGRDGDRSERGQGLG